MSDRTETPTPDTAQDVFADAIDALSLLREHGYRIVTAADAAKLDRLRGCVAVEDVVDTPDGGWTTGAVDLWTYLNGDGERP